MGGHLSSRFRKFWRWRRVRATLFYAFDAPVLAGADLRSKPLATRREMLREVDLKVAGHDSLLANLPTLQQRTLMAAVRSNGLEGAWQSAATAYTRPGDRSGAWAMVYSPESRSGNGDQYIPSIDKSLIRSWSDMPSRPTSSIST